VITNRAPTTALHALASRLTVLAVVELNPNALGVHARRCFPHNPNVIGLLPPRAAFILPMEALEAHALRIAVPALPLKLFRKSNLNPPFGQSIQWFMEDDDHVFYCSCRNKR